MRLDYTHAIATAYADAFEPGAAEAAELARLLPTLADATLAHPFALARRLMHAGFACRDRDGSRYGFDSTEANVREVIGPAVRGFARFTRHQLSFTLDEALAPMTTDHSQYNTRNFPHFVCNNGNFDIYANDAGYCASIPTDNGKSIGCIASHFGDRAYVRATLGVDPFPASAPTLPPTDTAMPAPSAIVAGLIPYCLPGRYGWLLVGALSAADAMRQAARGSSLPPDRAALMVHDGAEWVPAAPDSSEGAPVSLAEFWRRYGAELAGAIEAGTLPRRGEQGATVRAQAAHFVANGQRHVASDGWGILTYDGPAMKATLKAFGVWGGKVRFTRAAALAFVRGLA